MTLINHAPISLIWKFQFFPHFLYVFLHPLSSHLLFWLTELFRLNNCLGRRLCSAFYCFPSSGDVSHETRLFLWGFFDCLPRTRKLMIFSFLLVSCTSRTCLVSQKYLRLTVFIVTVSFFILASQSSVGSLNCTPHYSCRAKVIKLTRPEEMDTSFQEANVKGRRRKRRKT